jgi:hypothetical protein
MKPTRIDSGEDKNSVFKTAKSLWKFDDTTGQGHRSRTIDNPIPKTIFVTPN